jgi:hypothetical protein
MTNTYETGSTVTLRAVFTDIITGQPTNTDELPTVIIYDSDYVEIGSFTAVAEDVGRYKLVYSIPSGTKPTTYFYEFKGSLTGIIALNRNKFYARFYS